MYDATIVDGTGDDRAMASLHWSNRSRRSVIVSSGSFRMIEDKSCIVHVSIDMEWMIRSYGVIEVWER